MAIYREDIINVELNCGNINRSFLHRSIGMGDQKANRFGVRTFRNGQPENIGGTCTGLFIRADGGTVAITEGTVNGNMAYVTLPEACYAVEGVFSLAIRCTGGDVTGTLRIVDGVVTRTSTETSIDPGTVMPSIDELLTAIDEAVNSIPEDYTALMKMLTIEAQLISGYEIRGKYISSTTAEAVTSAGTYAYASTVPVKKGKKYTFTAIGTTNIAAVCECDQWGGNREIISVYAEDDTPETFVYVPEKDGYILLSYDYSENYSLTYMNNTASQISEEKANMIDLAGIVIGKDWTGEDNNERAVMNVLVEPGKDYFISVPVQDGIYSVSLVEKDGYTVGKMAERMVYNGEERRFTTTAKTNRIIVQVNATGGHTLTEDDFEDYPIYLYEGEYNADETAIDTKARALGTAKDNIINLDDIVIGKDWTGATNANRATVIVPIKPGKEYTAFIPASANWNSVSLVQKKDKWNVSILSETVDAGQAYSFITEDDAYWMYIQFNGSATITAGMFSNYDIRLVEGTSKNESEDREARKAALPWKGKKLVWLGTSIPAAGKYGLDNRHAYPDMVGDIIGAKVFNEAVGSSALHCKSPALITENNPYGFLNNFEAVSRCLTNSLEEMEWIIEHYNDSNVFTMNVPQSLSADDQDFIRSCSWEIKLEQYFTAGKFPDVWVFDHGHNDNPTETSEARYTARTALTGTQESGYYSGGVFVGSADSGYLEFDVEDVEEVFLTGTIAAGHDLYDLFDDGGNLVGYQANVSQREAEDLLIDTSGADVLRISTANAQISGIEVKKYTYGSMYNSLYSFQGCMDFLINKIKEYNPKARIIMIGEYENQKLPQVSYYQEQVAERWEFPLYRQWEVLGWSQQVVKVNGEYKTMLNVFIPDNLHPHSDTTGKALNMMAENIAAWMNTIRP